MRPLDTKLCFNETARNFHNNLKGPNFKFGSPKQLINVTDQNLNASLIHAQNQNNKYANNFKVKESSLRSHIDNNEVYEQIRKVFMEQQQQLQSPQYILHHGLSKDIKATSNTSRPMINKKKLALFSNANSNNILLKPLQKFRQNDISIEQMTELSQRQESVNTQKKLEKQRIQSQKMPSLFDDTVTIAKFINKLKIYDSKSRIKISHTQKNSPNTSVTRNNFLTLDPNQKQKDLRKFNFDVSIQQQNEDLNLNLDSYRSPEYQAIQQSYFPTIDLQNSLEEHQEQLTLKRKQIANLKTTKKPSNGLLPELQIPLGSSKSNRISLKSIDFNTTKFKAINLEQNQKDQHQNIPAHQKQNLKFIKLDLRNQMHLDQSQNEIQTQSSVIVDKYNTLNYSQVMDQARISIRNAQNLDSLDDENPLDQTHNNVNDQLVINQSEGGVPEQCFSNQILREKIRETQYNQKSKIMLRNQLISNQLNQSGMITIESKNRTSYKNLNHNNGNQTSSNRLNQDLMFLNEQIVNGQSISIKMHKQQENYLPNPTVSSSSNTAVHNNRRKKVNSLSMGQRRRGSHGLCDQDSQTQICLDDESYQQQSQNGQDHVKNEGGMFYQIEINNNIQ
eukprot:403338531